MISVSYCGTWKDFSGYGQANRNFITSLVFAGVDVTTELVTQVGEQASFGWQGLLCENLSGRNIPYKVKIIHLTPDIYPVYMETGKYHIGHLFWETDRLPKEWVPPCNQMNEIWTASPEQAEMIKKSGVTVPIFSFPQPVDSSLAGYNIPSFRLPDFGGFVFYSIFQWIERKNPKALITNYWKTFEGKDDVVLIIKTYGVNYSDNEFDRIKNEINSWKIELKLNHYPRVLLLKKLMSSQDILRLHKTGNCFVTAHRGEGWCIPAIEAMIQGKPVIAPNQTGFADYLHKDTYYPCKTKLVQTVESPSIPWYTSDQKWGEIDAKDLSKQMLDAYTDQKKAKEIGDRAQDFVKSHFSYTEVGSKLRGRIEEIQKFI